MRIEHKYDDIIKLEHHVSKIHPRMSIEARSAQFAPFSAVTGYEDEVQLATCSVADILLKIETLEKKKDTIISENIVKSESVGDYSRTLETTTLSDIEIQISNQKDKIKEELRNYLLCTGLLYRGV